jgi:hypothetical protein
VPKVARMSDNLWVELVGSFIIARVRGAASEEIIRECQDRVVALLRNTDCRKILYDALEMNDPSVDVALVQQKLSEQLREFSVRLAIVVPDTRIAYLGRIAFGDAEHRVFYNDMGAAVTWLVGAQP